MKSVAALSLMAGEIEAKSQKRHFALVSKIQYCSTHSDCVFQTEEAFSTRGVPRDGGWGWGPWGA